MLCHQYSTVKFFHPYSYIIRFANGVAGDERDYNVRHGGRRLSGSAEKNAHTVVANSEHRDGPLGRAETSERERGERGAEESKEGSGQADYKETSSRSFDQGVCHAPLWLTAGTVPVLSDS